MSIVNFPTYEKKKILKVENITCKSSIVFYIKMKTLGKTISLFETAFGPKTKI